MENQHRLTVGILPDSHIYTGMYPSWFYPPIIRGAQAAAREEGINLLVACGILHGADSPRYRLAWPIQGENVDFVPVGPWNTDGLLVFSPLRTEQRIGFIRELQERNFPVLFIGSGTGSPTIQPDNEGGIRQSLEHLVGHGHRAIAFIAGDPQDPGDSLSRINAYRKGVRELALSDDPRLLEYGLHWNEEGYRAMKRMLASGVKFTAVMCSNDFSSLGVVRALTDSGLRIPQDIAVTGFDDEPDALTQIPPLTSVHYPQFETGYRALQLIRKRIEEGPDALPAVVKVPTRLVARQSCGCFPDIVTAAAPPDAGSITEPAGDPVLGKRRLVEAMQNAIQKDSPTADRAETSGLCGQLVDGFLQSMADGEASHFRVALLQILQQIEQVEGDAHAWQAAISQLRLGTRGIRSEGPEPAGARRGEDLLHQARTLLSESTRRRFVRLQLMQTYHDEALGRLTAKLLHSLDESRIYSTLEEDLPKVGVRGCQVVFFEAQDGNAVAGSVIHAREGIPTDLQFESAAFPPPGLYPEDKPFNLAILPMFFQEENLGYVAFDGEDLGPLAMIMVQLVTALQSAQLHKKVMDLSLTDGLTGVYNRRYFEILLLKEAERSERYNRDLAVVIIDIDRFKDYNDRFGHPAGDEALRTVARCITYGARRGLDLVTRYGGEEFAVILPETDCEGARIVAENIHGQIRAENHLLRKLTVSLGIASLHGEQLRSGELVGEADRALYQAKRQGRDRAVSYEDWMAESARGDAPENKSADAPAP